MTHPSEAHHMADHRYIVSIVRQSTMTTISKAVWAADPQEAWVEFGNLTQIHPWHPWKGWKRYPPERVTEDQHDKARRELNGHPE